MPITIEAEFSPGMPLAECQEVARLAEAAGFDRLGVSDVVLWPDTFIVQALCAQVTERIEIGSMVSSPYLRHPAVTAAAVANLAELSGGRAFLGFGVGAGYEVVGIGYPRPAASIREAIAVLRALWSGETVTLDGEIYSLAEAALRQPPVDPIRLAIGTRSERVAGIAGELAETALVGARYLSPGLASDYRSWVTAGERRAGRAPGTVEIAPRLTLCASPDREAAYRTMRRDAAEFLVTLRPADLDVDPDRFARIEAALAEKKGWYFDPEAYHPPELDTLVGDDLVEAFSLCGPADELVPQFRRITDLGFSSISLKLAPVRKPGWSMFDGLRETITTVAEVLPAIRALEAAPVAS